MITDNTTIREAFLLCKEYECRVSLIIDKGGRAIAGAFFVDEPVLVQKIKDTIQAYADENDA